MKGQGQQKQQQPSEKMLSCSTNADNTMYNKLQSQQSKVLLVCFYNINGLIISHNILYNLFSQYGEVVKILIFEKTKIWKLFVQYEDIQSSVSAYNNLQNFQIFSDGSRLSISYSKIDNLKLNKFKNQGIDYQQGQKPNNQNIHLSQNLTISSQTSEDNSRQQSNEQIVQISTSKRQSIMKFSTYDQSQIKRASIYNNNQDDEHSQDSFQPQSYQKLRKIKTQFVQDQQINSKPKKPAINKSVNVDHDYPVQNSKFTFQDLIEEQRKNNLEEINEFDAKNENEEQKQEMMQLNLNELDDVLSGLEQKLVNDLEKNEPKQQQKYLQQQQQQQQEEYQNYYDNQQLNNQNIIQENIQQQIQHFNMFFNQKMFQNKNYSQILVLKQVNLMILNLEMIFNLFCNYGNIDFIFFVQNKNVILIQYENLISAINAQDLLQNRQFLNITLQIQFSKFQCINKALNDIYLTYYPNKKQNRFYDYCNLQINPPSETLHVSNISTKSFKKKKLLEIFSAYGKVVNFEIIDTENQKNMCFIQYANIQESFQAIAYLHGYKLNGRNLRLSFTKTKLALPTRPYDQNPLF